MNLILVALGGALGSALRYLTVQGAARLWGSGFPYGTMIVNILGSFLIGVAVALLVDRINSASVSPWAPFVMTGVLGGFTTFSAFSLDAYLLLEDGRLGAAVLYSVASVIISLLALALGITLARIWL